MYKFNILEEFETQKCNLESNESPLKIYFKMACFIISNLLIQIYILNIGLVFQISIATINYSITELSSGILTVFFKGTDLGENIYVYTYTNNIC